MPNRISPALVVSSSTISEKNSGMVAILAKEMRFGTVRIRRFELDEVPSGGAGSLIARDGTTRSRRGAAARR